MRVIHIWKALWQFLIKLPSVYPMTQFPWTFTHEIEHMSQKDFSMNARSSLIYNDQK